VHRLRVLFSRDVQALALREPYGTAVHAVLLGLVSATEALIRRAVRAEPESLPAMLQAIDGMRASVLRVGQPVETRFGPMN
jgi:hypothetical protein